MGYYKVQKTGSTVNVLKAPATGGPYTIVDPAPARAIHTYGSGALGIGADNDAGKQTALTIFYDYLADGPSALSMTPILSARYVAKWSNGSFIGSASLNTLLSSQSLPFGATVALKQDNVAYLYAFTGEQYNDPWDLGTDLGYMACILSLTHDAEDGTLDLKVQESDDAITYSDVAGAAFPQYSNSSAQYVFTGVVFQPTKRYVRTYGVLAGSAPAFYFSTTFLRFPGQPHPFPISFVAP